MAADFDAGSIEGTLDLDTSPFYTGLARAREAARRFERDRLANSASEGDTHVNVGVRGVARAVAGVNRLRSSLDRLRSLGATGLMAAGFMLLGRSVGKVTRKFMLLTVAIHLAVGRLARRAVSMLTNRFVLLGLAVVLVTAAMSPLLAVVLAFAAAAAAAFGGILIGVALFGAAVKSAMGDIMAANEAGEKLSGWAGKAQQAFAKMKGAWSDLMDKVKPAVFKVLATVFNGLAKVLPKLAPLIKVVAEGMNGVAKAVMQLLNGPQFSAFLKELTGFMGGFLKGLGPLLVNMLTIFMNLFTQLQPLMSAMGRGILAMTEGLASFTSEGGGMTKFLDKAMKHMPATIEFFKTLWGVLKNLAAVLGPLVGPALALLNVLAKGLLVVSAALIPVSQFLAKILSPLKDLNTWLGNLGLTSDGAGRSLKNGLGAALAAVQPGIEAVKGSVSRIAAFIQQAAPKVLAFARVIGGILAPAFKSLGKFIANEVIPVVAQMYEWFITKIIPVVAGALAPVLKELAKVFRDKVVPGVQKLFRAIKPLIPVLQTVAEWVVRLGAWIIKKLVPPLIRLVGWLIGKVFSALAGTITWLIKAGAWIGRTGKKVWDFAKDVAGAIGDVVGWFQSLPGKISALGGRFLSAGKTLMSKIFEGLKSGVTKVSGIVGSVATAAFNGLKSLINQGIDLINQGIPNDLGWGKLSINIADNPIPHLARGGVTRKAMAAVIGDNPGGREAVIPLNEYDIPKKGDLRKMLLQASMNDGEVIGLLRALLAKRSDIDTDTLADALGRALSKHSTATMREMVRVARAGG